MRGRLSWKGKQNEIKQTCSICNSNNISYHSGHMLCIPLPKAVCIFVYDISLACFGSAVLGFVVAVTAYSAERRDVMEQFWDEGIELTNGIRRIKHIEFDEPIELVKDAIKEKKGSFLSDNKDSHAKEKLKEWIAENQFPDDGRLDYEEVLEKHYQRIIKAYRQAVIDCALRAISKRRTQGRFFRLARAMPLEPDPA